MMGLHDDWGESYSERQIKEQYERQILTLKNKIIKLELDLQEAKKIIIALRKR
jgi:hypothetical protein